ncbi:DNA/RNA nuclease SfsA [Roseobacter sp. N2S]|uniref:DNA/RNA nuclease SfsA n=1 Tax=Roseobacter sp. N2S TaxID=2663844 RepID=UPI00285A5F77|nr:DNA/RNA nuclease SfsA [Roseobacter sp. N2S]MDR6263339.1 sugar fermentation stimulation protein A [Roseobacter sp. N2S]
MKFSTPLLRATLIRRYKRFLADCVLEDGREITAHCANTGAMTGLNHAGQMIWLEPNDDPKRKLNYSWKFVELQGGHFAGIDTSIANKLVAEALHAKRIAPVAAYSGIKPEAKYGQNSRIDFLLTGDGLPDAYIEVKNVTLKGPDDWAEFPDTVTARGTKHLGELTEMVAQGHRAIMLYLVQRTDCARFRLAHELDPAYAAAYATARAAGVEMLCYTCEIAPTGISLTSALPVLQK